jgi:hypothetical protein
LLSSTSVAFVSAVTFLRPASRNMA